jgi:proline iminopeptidase
MRIKKAFKFISIGLLVISVITVSAGLLWRGHLQDKTEASRPAINASIGINELFEIDIGGIQQTFHVRGSNKANPVVLYLHGGPGTPMIPFTSIFQNDWEQGFTVVQWDQRGVGKTYMANQDFDYAPVMSYELMLADAKEVVAMLKQRYNKQKVVIVGHSWGSMLGLGLIQAIPEDISAYIGTGQVINIVKNEAIGYQGTLAEAKRKKDTDAITALEALAPYPDDDGQLDRNKMRILRFWQQDYGFGSSRRFRGTLGDIMLNLALASPEYTLNDIRYFFVPQETKDNMWPQLKQAVDDFDANQFGLDFAVPMYFFLGRHDWQTPSVLANEWQKTINAPFKQVVWLENSAHSPMVDEPKVFADAMLNLVRPVVLSNTNNGFK